MHHWRHINRQKLRKLINQHTIEVNEQLGYDDGKEVDYSMAVGIASAELITKDYPSKNCGEIFGRRITRRR